MIHLQKASWAVKHQSYNHRQQTQLQVIAEVLTCFSGTACQLLHCYSRKTGLVPAAKHTEEVPVCLQQDCRAEVLVLIPPVARAAGAAACAQNALIQAIQLAAVILSLRKLLARNSAHATHDITRMLVSSWHPQTFHLPMLPTNRTEQSRNVSAIMDTVLYARCNDTTSCNADSNALSYNKTSAVFSALPFTPATLVL